MIENVVNNFEPNKTVYINNEPWVLLEKYEPGNKKYKFGCWLKGLRWFAHFDSIFEKTFDTAEDIYGYLTVEGFVEEYAKDKTPEQLDKESLDLMLDPRMGVFLVCICMKQLSEEEYEEKIYKQFQNAQQSFLKGFIK
jgi:hypothetical protein